MSEDRCACCGEIIPEGRQVCPACETGKNCGSKADQMFRELGYKRINFTADEYWYRKCTPDGYITIIIDVTMKTVVCMAGKESVYLSFDEILACAQLIREMAMEAET